MPKLPGRVRTDLRGISMTCRVGCQPEPRRHWPIFSPPDLPDGSAEGLVCGDWITAIDLIEGMCAGYPTTEGVSGGCTQDGQPAAGAVQPIDGGPVSVAPLFDARDVERERTVAMIQRCAERQL